MRRDRSHAVTVVLGLAARVAIGIIGALVGFGLWLSLVALIARVVEGTGLAEGERHLGVVLLVLGPLSFAISGAIAGLVSRRLPDGGWKATPLSVPAVYVVLWLIIAKGNEGAWLVSVPAIIASALGFWVGRLGHWQP